LLLTFCEKIELPPSRHQYCAVTHVLTTGLIRQDQDRIPGSLPLSNSGHYAIVVDANVRFMHIGNLKSPSSWVCQWSLGVSSGEPTLQLLIRPQSHSFHSCSEAHKLGSMQRNVSIYISFSAFLSSSPTQLECCAARLYQLKDKDEKSACIDMKNINDSERGAQGTRSSLSLKSLRGL
jgi:hypothetical protein